MSLFRGAALCVVNGILFGCCWCLSFRMAFGYNKGNGKREGNNINAVHWINEIYGPQTECNFRRSEFPTIKIHFLWIPPTSPFPVSYFVFISSRTGVECQPEMQRRESFPYITCEGGRKCINLIAQLKFIWIIVSPSIGRRGSDRLKLDDHHYHGWPEA